MKLKIVLFVMTLVSSTSAFAQTLYSVVSGTTNTNVCAGALVSAYGNFSGVSPQVVNQSTNVGGLQVKVNGVNAPMSYVSASQINFQVPYSASGTAVFQVVKQGAWSSQTVSRPLNAACLGGMPFNGQPQVTNATTGAIVGPYQPVAPGTLLTVWVAGGGQTSPAQSTGIPAYGAAWYNYPVSVTCSSGCNPGPIYVQYSGAAPGFVGLGQINFAVPSASPGMRALNFQSVYGPGQNIAGSSFNLFVTIQ